MMGQIVSALGGDAGMFAPGRGPGVLRTDERSALGFREVEIIRKRVQRSMRAKQDLGLIDQWKQLLAYYEGRYFKALPTSHQIAANWVFSIHRQMVAALYYQNPTFFMRGMSDLGRAVAPVMEPVFALEREVMGAAAIENDVLADALLLGCGFLKHGYNAAVSMDYPARLQGGVVSAGVAEVDDEEWARGPLVEFDPRINYGHPWVKRVRPWHVFIDADAKEWDEWRWICHRYSRPFIDVKEDGRLSESARSKLTATGKSGWFDDVDVQLLDEITKTAVRDDASMMVCYEYYDRTRNRVITLGDTGEEPLLDKEHAYFGKFTAWEQLCFFKANGHPYGLSVVEQFRPQAEALNTLRTQMLEHFNTFGQTRLAYLKNKLDTNTVKKIMAGQCPAAIGVDGNESIQEALKFLERAEVHPDAWKLQQLFHQDMVDVSGAYELSQRTAETATESLKLDEKSGLRIDKMRDVFDTFLQGSARRVLKVLKSFWGYSRIVPIVDDDAEVVAMEALYGQDVTSDYDVYVQPGSTERVDQAVRVRQIIDASAQLQTLDGLMQRQGKCIDFVELGKEFLRTVKLARNPERLIITLAEAQAQMMSVQQQMTPVDANGNPVVVGDGGAGAAGDGLGLSGLPGMSGMADATAVNAGGQMPWETEAGAQGRLASELFGGGAFGGGYV